MLSDRKVFWKKHKKQIIATASVICVVCFVAVIAVNAQKIKNNFDPNSYADKSTGNENSIEYDSSVFGADQSDDNSGLEMDDHSKDNYNLNDGQDQSILDHQNNPLGLQVADGNGTGNGTSNGNAVGVTNDGTGTVINGNGSGGTGNGTGGDGTGSGTGTGGGTGEGGSGSGTGDSGDNKDAPYIDTNAGPYGIDYNSSERVGTFIPKPGVVVLNIKITAGSLRRHFYEGEAPRSEEMKSYLTVTAYLSNGETQELNYRPNDAVGGDYTVEWGNNPNNRETNSIGYPTVGSNKGEYIAKISYAGKTIAASYDIVHWQVTLNDFEGESQPDDEYTQEYDTFPMAMSPEGSPIINLSMNDFGRVNQMQRMYNLIGARTDSMNDGSGYTYRHVNVKKDDDPDKYDSYYVEFFGGWTDSEDSISTGNTYKMNRPTNEQIVDGVYNIEMIPTWNTMENQGEYAVALDGFTGISYWTTKLLRYNGESSTLSIPEGVTTMDFLDYSLAIDGMQYDNSGDITKIVIPASLDTFDTNYNVVSDLYNLFPNLEEIVVDSNNQSFLSIDGILYDRTGKQLLFVPTAKHSINEWSEKLEEITPSSFRYTVIEEVNVPASVYKFDAYAFMDAQIDNLTFNCKDEIVLGTGIFEGTYLDSTDFFSPSRVTGVKKLNLKTSEIKTDSKNPVNLFMKTYGQLEEEGTCLQDTGFQIVVPDSENDSVYRSLLKSFQLMIDTYSGDMNTTYEILTTQSQAKDHYIYQDGLLLSPDQTILYQASFLLSGDLQLEDDITEIKANAFAECNKIASVSIPADLAKIDDGAFADMNELSALYMRGEEPPVFCEKIFGEEIPDGFKINVSGRSYQSYMTKVGPGIDQDYGDGTAARVFNIIDNLDEAVFNDGNIYFKNEDDTYSLYKVKGTIQGIFTPMEGTSEFLDGCFTNCRQLNGVVIPDTVKKLGSNLFTGCPALGMIADNAVISPELVADTFNGIEKGNILLLIPSNESSQSSYQAWDGFGRKEAVEASYVGDNSSTGNSAVYGKTGDDCKLIKAFVNTSKAFVLLAETTEIYQQAFFGCTNLTQVENAWRITTVGESAFEGCSSLMGIELWSATSLGKAAFRNCSTLTNLSGTDPASSTSLPWRITSLPDQCFYGCSTLAGLYISSDMDYIGERCFAECTNLRRIDFVGTVSKMGESCFENCWMLSQVVAKDPVGGGYYYSVPYGLDEVPANCFKGCSSIGVIQIVSRAVGESAFEGCSGLELLVFETDVSQLGTSSFRGCSGISEIISVNPEDGNEYYTLPYKLQQIPDQCFEGCSSVPLIGLQAGIVSIGKRAFYGCSSWSSTYMTDDEYSEVVELPDTITSIGSECFGNCSTLITVKCYSTALTLGDGAFNEATSLENISFDAIPQNITDLTDINAICDRYFRQCPLISLIMGDTDLLAEETKLDIQTEALEMESESSNPEEIESAEDGSVIESDTSETPQGEDDKSQGTDDSGNEAEENTQNLETNSIGSPE